MNFPLYPTIFNCLLSFPHVKKFPIYRIDCMTQLITLYIFSSLLNHHNDFQSFTLFLLPLLCRSILYMEDGNLHSPSITFLISPCWKIPCSRLWTVNMSCNILMRSYTINCKLINPQGQLYTFFRTWYKGNLVSFVVTTFGLLRSLCCLCNL